MALVANTVQKQKVTAELLLSYVTTANACAPTLTYEYVQCQIKDGTDPEEHTSNDGAGLEVVINIEEGEDE